MLGAEGRWLLRGEALQQMLDQHRSLEALHAIVEPAPAHRSRRDPPRQARGGVRAEQLELELAWQDSRIRPVDEQRAFQAVDLHLGRLGGHHVEGRVDGGEGGLAEVQ